MSKVNVAARLGHWTVRAHLIDAMRIWFRPTAGRKGERRIAWVKTRQSV